jgi:hypothetical protein
VNVQADFDFSGSATSLAVTRGGSGNVTFTITGQTGYNGTINFTSASCAGLPAQSTCSFNPSSVTGSGSSKLTITTTAPHSSSLNPLRLWGTGSSGIFAGVFVLGVASKRRSRNRLLGLLVLAGLAMLLGCGGGSGGGGGGGTPPGTYAIRVSATDGAHSHTANFNLIVQ